MYEYGVGSVRHGCLEQLERCRHSCYDPVHIRASFHLKSVWAIIPELGSFQQAGQIRVEFVAQHARSGGGGDGGF